MDAAQRQAFSRMPPPHVTTEEIDPAERAFAVRNGVSTEAKMAMLNLWRRNGRRPGKLIVHAREIGDIWGARDSLRSGKIVIASLEKLGYIKATKLKKGMWLIELIGLEGAAPQAFKVIPADAQGCLDFKEPPPATQTPTMSMFNPDVPPRAELPPEVVPPVPPVADLRIGIDQRAQPEGSRIRHKHPEPTTGATSGGSSGRTNDDDMRRLEQIAKIQRHEAETAEEQRMRMGPAFLAGVAIGRNDEARSPSSAREIFEWIMKEVDDPGLMACKAIQVSEDVARGLITRAEVAGLLYRIGDGRRRWIAAGRPAEWHKGQPFSAGKWFNRGMHYVYQRAGLPYTLTRKTSRTTSQNNATSCGNDASEVPY